MKSLNPERPKKESPADKNVNKGYSKEQYYQISEKQNSPKRCPIYGKCERAFQTKWLMSTLGKESFNGFLSSYGQELGKLIKAIGDPVEWSYSDIIKVLNNACPEVTLFEPDYLPHNFRQSAFVLGAWYKERSPGERFEAEAKHYSECSEFSEYIFHEKIFTSKNSSMQLAVQLPEKELEKYLTKNLEVLEPGLKFSPKKAIGNWEADIFACDTSGADVLIELKSRSLNSDKIDKLCGQIMRYYQHQKPNTHDLRLFIVIPNENKTIENLKYGFRPLIDADKISIFQFDYFIYSKKFTFAKLDLK